MLLPSPGHLLFSSRSAGESLQQVLLSPAQMLSVLLGQFWMVPTSMLRLRFWTKTEASDFESFPTETLQAAAVHSITPNRIGVFISL
ncbi:hypothetical protein E2P81_ATG03007 [Venturia nashicola]|nr:hypothetical protein E2P81_ATG03007 [Venturia nashicola]